MSVQLIKTGARITLGHPLKVHPDKILCDYCGQSYDFHYSPGEEHRLKGWLPKAGGRASLGENQNPQVQKRYPGHPAFPSRYNCEQ
jgi:hypothetical protein